MNLGGATAMASRRRRSATPRAVPPDLGTDETRRRLVPPPWADWPRELQEAAVEMRTAACLCMGRTRARASVMDPDASIGGGLGEDSLDDSGLGPYERRCYRKYRRWIDLMVAVGWKREIARVIDCIANHAPAGDVWQLRAALTLWATGRVLPRAS